MGELHQGGLLAIKNAGVKVETRLVKAEEAVKLHQNRATAFRDAESGVRAVLVELRNEVTRGKVTPTAATEIDKWIKRIGDGIFKLMKNEESEIIKNEGIKEALHETVISLKKQLDDLERKNKEIDEWDARPNKTTKDYMERPVGAEVPPTARNTLREGSIVHQKEPIEGTPETQEKIVSVHTMEHISVEMNNPESTSDKRRRRGRKIKGDPNLTQE